MSPLWVLPPAILAIGLVGLTLVVRNMTVAVVAVRDELSRLGEVAEAVRRVRTEASGLRLGASRGARTAD